MAAEADELRFGSEVAIMFTSPIWHRRLITVVVFLVLLWLASTGDTEVLRVMGIALAFWVPVTLHFFWRLSDAKDRDHTPDGGPR